MREPFRIARVTAEWRARNTRREIFTPTLCGYGGKLNGIASGCKKRVTGSPL